MNDINHPEEPLEPHLKELLDLLKETPPRDPEAEARGQAKFLAEVDELFSEPTRPIASRANLPVPDKVRSGWRFTLASLQPRLAFTTLMITMAIAVLLFGGAGATAFAAQGALPGDALYPLKTSLETTQVRLSRDAARQAQLHLDFAERRLDEIAALIADGRFDGIGTASQEFEAHVQQAINALETVSAGDPQRAKALAIQISSTLTRYSQILRDMLVKVPDPIKPAMEKALLTSEEESGEVDLSGAIESMAPDGLTVNGQFVKITNLTEIKGSLAVGAQVEVHAFQGTDGALTAREIEVSASIEVNANENGNANLNENEGDDNLNENEAGDNLNENELEDNLNANENEEDDNANLNENHNDNENGNQNLNENDNDHENDNNGSNQNLNENSNDNHNDNVGSNDNDNEHENDNGNSNTNNNTDD